MILNIGSRLCICDFLSLRPNGNFKSSLGPRVRTGNPATVCSANERERAQDSQQRVVTLQYRL